MNNNKTTKRALGSSIVALLICFTMLVGTTYAWFTDTVTSTGNVIKSGTLDVALTWTDDATVAEDAWNDVEADDADPIFAYELWEPGFTQVRYLKVENKGTLALKYKLQIVVHNETVNGTDVKLSDVIDVYYASEKVDVPDRDLENNDNLTYLGTLTQYLTGSAVADTLGEKDENGVVDNADYATLVLQMQESAGNEYQNLSVGTSFDIMLFATQLASESDSFGNNYDADADFPKFGYGSAAATGDEAGIDIMSYNNAGYKVGSVNVTKESYVTDSSVIEVFFEESDYVPNITIAQGSESETVDIRVLGIKEDNQAPITVQYRLSTGLNPDKVKVYHYSTEIPSTYNPSTGYVIFQVTEFSPFTVEFDAESEWNPYDPNDTTALPQANVVNSPENENVDLEWQSYGGVAPTPGLDAQLEAAYTFSCLQDFEQAKANKYAEWYCDFYVKLDRDLGADQIFLGGNYGSFGWVGFHNGTLTLDADTEIGLLESVTTNPWTYLQVVQNVGEFICGVGDVDDALYGATFTVMLRLTNPEDTTEFYNVATVTYTFGDATTPGTSTIVTYNPASGN